MSEWQTPEQTPVGTADTTAPAPVPPSHQTVMPPSVTFRDNTRDTP